MDKSEIKKLEELIKRKNGILKLKYRMEEGVEERTYDLQYWDIEIVKCPVTMIIGENGNFNPYFLLHFWEKKFRTSLSNPSEVLELFDLISFEIIE